MLLGDGYDRHHIDFAAQFGLILVDEEFLEACIQEGKRLVPWFLQTSPIIPPSTNYPIISSSQTIQNPPNKNNNNHHRSIGSTLQEEEEVETLLSRLTISAASNALTGEGQQPPQKLDSEDDLNGLPLLEPFSPIKREDNVDTRQVSYTSLALLYPSSYYMMVISLFSCYDF